MSTAMNWDPGDLCEVVLEGKKYPGKVLETAFSAEGDYLQIKLEYYVEWEDWQHQKHITTKQWPKPIQSYKLRRRHWLLPGEKEPAPKQQRKRAEENRIALEQIALRLEAK